MKRAGVALLLTALVAAGCGSTPSGTGTLRHWPARAPYLPPPDPAAYARQPAHAPATTPPARSGAAPASSGAPTDAEVERELREALGAPAGASARELIDRATLTPDGLATVPPGAPPRVAAIIRGGNEVARKPYVYGGGHGRLAGETWIDTAYDCSGSISFALANAGLAQQPMDSTALSRWGRPGPGRWVTIYANAGHAFMTVAGLRFDTSGRQETGSRWQDAGRTVSGFTIRHPPGL
ncbi:MAG TPA: hypothetical protein VLB47_07895 [Solirubrobacteraceae bacterium]|nr:hypothetical protein [Solirubrobacteraceae bacterium]